MGKKPKSKSASVIYGHSVCVEDSHFTHGSLLQDSRLELSKSTIAIGNLQSSLSKNISEVRQHIRTFVGG